MSLLSLMHSSQALILWQPMHNSERNLNSVSNLNRKYFLKGLRKHKTLRKQNQIKHHKTKSSEVLLNHWSSWWSEFIESYFYCWDDEVFRFCFSIFLSHFLGRIFSWYHLFVAFMKKNQQNPTPPTNQPRNFLVSIKQSNYWTLFKDTVQNFLFLYGFVQYLFDISS